MKLSHIDKQGDARMVDVGGKKIQRRSARASGMIRLAATTIESIKDDQIKSTLNSMMMVCLSPVMRLASPVQEWRWRP